MGDIDWVVQELSISLVNELTVWIMAIACLLTIFEIIWRIINDNSK